ncbi:dimethylarginine dimethylaminohydrolase family protein [Flavihumibacter fluvii]|uniref:dimethylarginine dimethylaminohydrolase family protein n=1 Tax=Flavihumibacter fluvii TaxID=2838157 RepID=UPI001BDEAF41|nr:arginine deiminase family protein [Flavihumibacter fluvii]ULQ53990.1 arginine deiminase family protein [Flavihumibacter fluvii]
MKKTCHSEFGTIQSVFIKPIVNAFIDDNHIEKEWKVLNFTSKPDFEKGRKEYAAFEKLLGITGARISHFPADTVQTLDAMYCRDASIATDYGMIICNMGKPQRKTEPEAHLKSFNEIGLPILGSIKAPGTVEGGDLAWLNATTLAVGHTYRTNENGIGQLKALLEPRGISVITVPLPHYKGPSDVFHLMSVLSPVDHNLAVVYSPLMPIVFRQHLIGMGYELVEVPDEEFGSMGCNVLAIAPRVCIMVSGNPTTKAALENAGCKVYEYEGQEISVKGGGGPTCLTRPIQRIIQ